MEKAWVPNQNKILYKTTIKKAKKGQIEEREGERYFGGRIGDVFNIRGNSGYFCCPPNTPKIWGTPDCGPTSIEFQREQFQNATNNFLGSGTCVFINWGTFINRN